MTAQRKYPEELRERAVKMVAEIRERDGKGHGEIARVGRQLGVHPEALRSWLQQAEIDKGKRPGTTTDDKQRIAELEREVRELRRANEILKAASAYFREGTRPGAAALVEFADAHRDRFGIEPACAVLEFPVSSYYHAKKREAEPTAREIRDAVLKEKVMEVWKGRKGREVYGARKVWLELSRQGVPVARCTVERLMRDLEVGGVRSRRKRPRTTVPGDPAGRPSDLLQRCFDAPAPNRRWVAGITYVMTFSGWVYTAFVMDLFARRIVGWQMADHLRSDLALDALEMAIWARRHEDIGGLVHHSGRGVRYTAIRYTERLGEARAVRSVGSKGDSYDNAAAEALNSLYKRELIDFKKGWQGVDDVMLATMDWVSWYNEERIHSYCGDMPPKEYEEIYYKALESAKLTSSSQT
ncbi:MAG TPA: IS3 family transposase [Opitutaceae bacterium]|nr:IS3 family transposase [Opitutaceae bacterium]